MNDRKSCFTNFLSTLVLFLVSHLSFSQPVKATPNHSVDSILSLYHSKGFKDLNDTIKDKIYSHLISTWQAIDLDSAVHYATIAINELKNRNENFKGFQYQLAFLYMEMGENIKSIEILNELYKNALIDKNGNEQGISLAFLAMNYQNLGNYEKALEQARKIIPPSEDEEEYMMLDNRGYPAQHWDLAKIFIGLHAWDSAEYHIKIAQRRVDNMKLIPGWNDFFYWQIHSTYGRVLTHFGHYDEAMNQFKLALNAINKAKEKNHGTGVQEAYLGMAELYEKINKPDSVVYFSQMAFQALTERKQWPELMSTSLMLSRVYEAKNKFAEALKYLHIYQSIKDQMITNDINLKAQALEYDRQLRDKDFNALLAKEAFNKKQTGFITSIFIASLMAAYYYYRYQNKQKELLREKERLEIDALKAQLNPHFIFNCINSIDAFIYSNDKLQATTYLNKFAKLLRNILDSSKNNLVPFVKDIETLKLYTELEELRHDYTFTTVFDIDKSLENEKINVPPLIVQPIIENAILHGLGNKKDKSGLLNINASLKENKIIYTIKDNGVGRKLANELKKSENKSYGLSLTESRIKLFNQSNTDPIQYEDLKFENNSAGTIVTVTLNLAA